jgi:hypothetical protein
MSKNRTRTATLTDAAEQVAAAQADNAQADYGSMSAADLQQVLNDAIVAKDGAIVLAIGQEIDKRKAAQAELNKLLATAKKATKENVSTHNDSVTAVINAALAYATVQTPETLDAFVTLADALGDADHPAFSVRIDNYTVRKLTRERKTNDSNDERTALNADALREKQLAAFVLDDGSDATVQVRKAVVSVHPRAYLDNVTPTTCYYERECPTVRATIAADKDSVTFTKNDDGTHTITAPAELVAHLDAFKKDGSTISAAQYESLQSGELKHGDAAARALVKHGMTDTTHNVRMNDGSVQTVSEFIKAACAASVGEEGDDYDKDSDSEGGIIA